MKGWGVKLTLFPEKNTLKKPGLVRVNQDIKRKNNFLENHGHNILRLFNVLPNFPFTTSEKKCDY